MIYILILLSTSKATVHNLTVGSTDGIKKTRVFVPIIIITKYLLTSITDF